MDKKRIFIAINLSDPIKQRLLKVKQHYFSVKNIRWVDKANLHLTLVFLGDVKLKKINKIVNKVTRAIKSHKKFSLKANSISTHNKRLIWANIELNPGLKNLQQDIVNILNLKKQRLYTPHLTLARGKNLPSIKANIKFEFIADNVAIMESQLSPQGAIYSPIKIIKL